MDRIRKLTNISEVQVPVQLVDGTTVFVPPKGKMENISVENYHAIGKFVKVSMDLGEVKEIKTNTKKKYLKG
jgi:hypothetical protein